MFRKGKIKNKRIIHPSNYIVAYLTITDTTLKEFSRKAKINYIKLLLIISKLYRIKYKDAKALSLYFGTTVEYWMNLGRKNKNENN